MFLYDIGAGKQDERVCLISLLDEDTEIEDTFDDTVMSATASLSSSVRTRLSVL